MPMASPVYVVGMWKCSKGGWQSQWAAEVVDSVLEVHVERAQPWRRRIQHVPASLGIPARDVVEQERLEIRRIRGSPRDEVGQMEVAALQGQCRVKQWTNQPTN